MAIKLDHKAKCLIYALSNNARLSYTQLSKITKISQETVRYRINNLLKQGIIRKFVAFINSSKLGYSAYQLMLKLQNVNEQKKKAIIQTLIENRHVNWVANVEGNYDIACIILVKNQNDLQEIVDNLYSFFGDTIIKKNISVIITSQFFSRDYLLNQKRKVIAAPAYGGNEKIFELDKKDSLLCSLLSENGRYTYIDLANKMNISADSVLQRTKRLHHEKIITGSTTIIDNTKIGQLHYKLLLHLNNLSENSINKLLDHIREKNRVIALMKTLAEWDYEVDIEVESVDQLKEFIMDLTSQFSHLIRDYSFIRIIDMPKYSLYNAI